MAKPKLFEQVRFAMRTRHLSYRTEQAPVNWIRTFIVFNDKRHQKINREVRICYVLLLLRWSLHFSVFFRCH